MSTLSTRGRSVNGGRLADRITSHRFITQQTPAEPKCDGKLRNVTGLVAAPIGHPNVRRTTPAVRLHIRAASQSEPHGPDDGGPRMAPHNISNIHRARTGAPPSRINIISIIGH